MSRSRCELCSNPARMFCDSDQASLCWGCDEKVHAANFLVAKHSRTLLCHVCHAPTPWKAAGPRLGPTVSVCHACASLRAGASDDAAANRQSLNSESDGVDDDDDDDDREYSTAESDDESSEEDEDVDVDVDVDENQVVPWSDSPPAVSTSGEEEEENVSLSSSKRGRDERFPSSSEDEDGCCSSQNAETSYELESYENCSPSSSELLRPLKRHRSEGGDSASEQAAEPSGTAAIVEKLRRFEQEIVREESVEASAMIIGLCNLTRD